MKMRYVTFDAPAGGVMTSQGAFTGPLDLALVRGHFAVRYSGEGSENSEWVRVRGSRASILDLPLDTVARRLSADPGVGPDGNAKASSLS